MRHTCCQLTINDDFRVDLMDSSEVADIPDENSEAIEQFENLLAELIDAYWASNLSFCDHLDGPWKQRTEDILHERQLDSENIEALGGLGVVLRPVD